MRLFSKVIVSLGLCIGMASATPSPYVPIMVDDIVMMIPYSDVRIDLGRDAVYGQDQETLLRPKASNEEGIVAYEWSENGQVIGTQSTFSTVSLSIGVHTLTLTVTDSNGARISDTITVTITEAMDESDLEDESGFVGTTKGEFGVDQGAASYRIEIDTPPGVAGMKPKLALFYNSINTQNGYLGVGWGLEGVSQITRCPQTRATDGAGHSFGIHYDGRDRFCLDGQRLIVVSGAYGADGAEYRTQIDRYAKIVSHGNTGGGPSWFEVRTKSGLVYRYGTQSDASLSSRNGAKRFWNVSRIEDSYGNGIDFHYYADAASGEHCLSSVTYADNRIDFYYQMRDDAQSGFTDGMPVSVTKRLSDVSVTTGDTFVRRYDIAYTPESVGSKRSRIATITEHTTNGDTADLHFAWDKSTNHGLLQTAYVLPSFEIKAASPAIQGLVKQNQGVQIADLNGDGLPDIIQLYKTFNNTVTKRVCLQQNGTFTCDNDYTNSLQEDWMSEALFSYQDKSLGTRLVDINGDGLPDLIRLYALGGVRRAWINTGNGFVPYTHEDTLPDAYFTGTDGKDMGTRLADINGDGMVDLIQLYIPQGSEYGGVPQRRVYLGSTSGFFYHSGYSQTIADLYFAQGGGRDMGTRLADINGDGLPDLIQLYLPDSPYYGGNIQTRVMLNTGSGFIMSPSYQFPDAYFADAQGRDMGTRLADLNGDGLPDLIQLYDATSYYGGDDQVKVYLNTGRTFIPNDSYTDSLAGQTLFFSNEEGRQRGTRLADINGDGLIDIVQLYLPSGGQGQRRVYLNDGTQFVRDNHYSDAFGDTYFNDSDGIDMGTRLVDMDGDGMLDVLQLFTPTNSTYYDGNEQRRVYLNTNNNALVTRIFNGFDEDIKIAYSPMTDGSVYHNYSLHGDRNRYPFNTIANNNIEITPSMPVVASVESMDGVGGDAKMRYQYYGYVFNKLWGMQGFHAVNVYNDTQKTQTTTYYKQFGVVGSLGGDTAGFAYTGMPYQVDVRKVGDGSVPTVLLERTQIAYKDTSSRFRIAEPYVYRKVHTVYDPDGSGALFKEETTTQMSGDGLGNVLRTIQTRTDLQSGIAKQTDTQNTYGAENAQAWHIGRLTASTVTFSQTGKSPIVRQSTFAYNDHGVLQKEVSDAGTPLALTTTYTYDSHGNKLTQTVSGTGVTTATTRFGYDSLGKFQTRITDALGYTVTKSYDPRFGTVTYLKDRSGTTTRWRYDGLGRKIEEIRPDGTSTQWRYSYAPNYIQAPNALYAVTVTTRGAPFKRVYYDAFGRETGAYTYTMKKGSRTAYEARRIVTRKYYNAKGELTREELPHFQNDTPGTIEYSYDRFGRVVSTTKTAAGNTYATYTYAYNGFAVNVTDSNGHVKRTVKNGMDQTVSVTDAYGSADASTVTYAYDAAGNLVATTDAAGNVVRMWYDAAGHKIKMLDPDKGEWHYAYDAAGRLVRQWSGSGGFDASANATYKSYDALGRLTRRMTYDAAGKSTDPGNYSYRQVDYSYYGTGASAGRRGKVMQTQSVSCMHDVIGDNTDTQTVEYTYDAYGRETVRKTKINARTLTIRRSYDYYGRLSKVFYPNGYALYYRYKNGLLERVGGSDGKTHYLVDKQDAFGQITAAHYANGVRTYVGTDNAGYVGSITTVKEAFGGDVQRLGYTYDGRGNVIRREDHSISGKHINETYAYDAMDRLTSVGIDSNANGLSSQTLTYAYDALGNITYKSDVGHYRYAAGKPHAVIAAGGRHYAYDSVGNMIDRNGDAIVYDPANKAAILTDHTTDTSVFLSYGAGDARILKTTDEGQTYYLGKAYEEEHTSSSIVKRVHITIGGKIVGVHVETFDAHYTPPIKEGVYNRYFHTDALGSVTAITDDSGNVVERRSYDPFGKIRAMDYGTNVNSTSNTTLQTDLAFTGHRSIQELPGLIDMGARMYDSDIGRFLSADTIIQDPYDTQAYNRYSYARNNPLKYTDPTGNSWWTKFRDKWLKPILAVAVGAAVAFFAPQFLSTYLGIVQGSLASAVATGALAGAAGGAIMTGTPKGALFGAISAGVAYGIGEALGHGGGSIFAKGFKPVKGIVKALSHGLSRGIIAKAQGGTFRSGFASGFAASLFSPGTTLGGDGAEGFTLRTTVAAVVGGTASELGGGKFANGAISGAFVHMFNAEAGAFVARARQKALQLSIDKIIAPFEKMRNLPLAQRLMLLYKFTKNGSILDFKQEGEVYQEYGNFVFGAVGAAMDIDDAILLRGAGWAQIKAGTSLPEWGSPFGLSAPYGDDPYDQQYIQYGIEYYEKYYRK